VQDAVRVGNEPAEVGLCKTFSRLSTYAHSGSQMPGDRSQSSSGNGRADSTCARRRRMVGEERQERVRGGAGDDFQIPQLLELAEGAHQVAPQAA